MFKNYAPLLIALLFFSLSQKSWAAIKDDFSSEDFEDIEFIVKDEIKINDPLEKYNRKIFTFNETVDKCCIEKIAKAYRNNMPKTVRVSVRNFLDNLYSPMTVFNSILQGKVDNSLATLSSFMINTTIGLGGIFDVAGKKGIYYNQEDFGQTLGNYGIDYGIYLVLPVFGPSSGRDLTGFAVDKAINPMAFNAFDIGENEFIMDANYRIASAFISGIDQRESLIDIIDGVRQDSFDPYATLRSAYLQKRFAEIKK